MAHSPELLLFRDLPKVLGLASFDEDEIDEEQVEIYFEHLNESIQTLANATPDLHKTSRDIFLVACGLPGGEEGWQMFRSLANELLPRATNPIIMPLLRRASETPDSRAALDSVLALIADRPLRSWTDQDTDRFSEQANYFGELIRIERNGSTPNLDLPPEKRQRSLEVATKLLSYIEELERDPQILEVALYMLTREILSKQNRP
jgi:hypothetical protein